jgi:hypothetical protein
MDMYGGFPMGAPPSSPSKGSMKKYALIGVACILLLVAVYFMFFAKKAENGRPASPKAPGGAQVMGTMGMTQLMQQGPVVEVTEAPIEVEAPDIKVGVFAFESLTKPGYVPTVDGTLGQKGPGMPPFKFVACGGKGYAIRWNGVYLTLTADKGVEWHEEKLEPDSCWMVVPGQCGSTAHVMLRNAANKSFLRFDAATNTLVCKDGPTGRTAQQYCWKLAPDPVVVRQPCGCQYSYELGRVVCTPCNVKEMPGSPGESCSTVTDGYKATCCIRKGRNASSDAFCDTVAWPQVVGRTIQEAMLYIRTRRPDLTLKPCPSPCTAEAYPTPSPHIVAIPYDPRSGIVTAAARRLI